MKKYKVKGLFTISFEMEVEAENKEEAMDKGYNVHIAKDWSGNAIISDIARLIPDGEPFNIQVKVIDKA